MSAKKSKLIKRAVRDAVAAKGLSGDALFASKLKRKPRWMPGFAWGWMLRQVLKEPPARVPAWWENRVRWAVRAVAKRMRRRSSLTAEARHP